MDTEKAGCGPTSTSQSSREDAETSPGPATPHQPVFPIGKPSPDEHPSALMQPIPAYTTDFGAMFHVDSSQGMAVLPDDCVDLVVTSPPYALHFKKEYGNADKEDYVDWFRPFGRQLFRILKPSGSLVLNITSVPRNSAQSSLSYRM